MDPLHHHHPHRLIPPPTMPDPSPSPSLPHQSSFWYPSSSPPPPPGGYHHHLSPPAPLPPHHHTYPHHPPPYYPGVANQYHHHHHIQNQPPPPPTSTLPPYTLAPPSYQNHMEMPPMRYPPPPPRSYGTPPPPHPGHPSTYPQPDQAWGNSSWAQHQGWEYPERNIPYNEDWAARARAWVTAESATATEYHHTPSQVTSFGRTDGHNYAYHDQYQQGVAQRTDAQQSFPQPSIQQLPDFRKQDSLQELTSFTSGSSYYPDGHVLHNTGDEAMALKTAHMSPLRKSHGPSSSICEQEVPYIYSSAPGNRETVDRNESSRIPLPLPVSSVQAPLHSQTTFEQSHFTHGGQSTKPSIDPSDLPLDFEPRSAYGREAHQKTSYGNADPTGTVGMIVGGSIATSIHAWNSSQVPSVSSGTQFDTSFGSQPSLPFGGIPGPNFRSPIPAISAPFSLASGAPLHHAVAFPGDGNGAFNFSERPKKAAVPNWLREEIIKKGPAIASAVPTHPMESSFHSVGSEDADKSLRFANQADSKSVDSTRSTEDEEDDEDNVEIARSAAINQEIKRVLTEVLLKVTDQLFDEIATKVLSEDEHSVEVAENTGNPNVSPPPAVLTPKASAKVVVQVKKDGVNANGASDNSSPRSPPGGDVLGLANYASDDSDNDESVRKRADKGNVLLSSQEPGHGHKLEDERKKMDVYGAGGSSSTRNTEENPLKTSKEVSGFPEEIVSTNSGKFNEAPQQIAPAPKPLKGKRPESTNGTANNGKSIAVDCSDIEPKTIISTSAYPMKSNNKDSVKEVKTGKDRADHKISDASDFVIHEERNAPKKNMEKRDYPKEGDKRGVNEGGSGHRSSSKNDNIKDDRKENKQDKRDKDRKDGERKREQTRDGKEDRSTRVMKDSSRYSNARSSSPSSRGRTSKGNSSSDEPSENSKKRKLSSDRRNLSPSPARSTKRQVSRSPNSKHSHRRHSPYSSMERRRRSRSRTPVHHRSAYKHHK